MHRTIATSLATLCVLFGLLAGEPRRAQERKAPVNWAEVLAPRRGEMPPARDKVEWLDDFDKALALAKKEKRPLFVTLRCLPCKQCSAFDADVLDGGARLDPLLRQFVTVRLTSMRAIDQRILPWITHQDLDLSWWGYFLSDEGHFYGVYGGKDEAGDDTRISERGLIDALGRVLDHHYDVRRKAWNLEGQAPDLRKGKALTPKTHGGWKPWTKHGAKEVADSECLHCHQCAEILRQPAIDNRKFDKQKDFDIWPFPENVGLKLDRDAGLKVTQVIAGSPAEKLGLKAGDELGAAGTARLFSQTDFRGALHRLPAGDARLELVWLSGGEVKQGTLELRGEWRKTDLGWRKSVAEADIGAQIGMNWPLACSDKERQARGIGSGVLCVKPYAPKGLTGPAAEAGMKTNDFVVAVNGEMPDLSARAFIVWFRLKFEPGDTITLTLVDPQGKKRDIKYKAEAKWR